MGVDVSAAVIVGLLSGVVMETPAYVAKAAGLGMRQDIFREGGALFRLHGVPGYLAGIALHFSFSAWIALAYVAFFSAVGAHEHLWLWGLVAAVVHYVIGAAVIALLPLVHPEMPEPIPAPGLGYRRYGLLDVGQFLIGHLIFGVLLGFLYELLTRSVTVAGPR